MYVWRESYRIYGRKREDEMAGLRGYSGSTRMSGAELHGVLAGGHLVASPLGKASAIPGLREEMDAGIVSMQSSNSLTVSARHDLT